MSGTVPTQALATGLTVSDDVGVTMFGGFAPCAMTWPIDPGGKKLAPGVYLMFCAVASLPALYAVQDKLKIR